MSRRRRPNPLPWVIPKESHAPNKTECTRWRTRYSSCGWKAGNRSFDALEQPDAAAGWVWTQDKSLSLKGEDTMFTSEEVAPGADS